MLQELMPSATILAEDIPVHPTDAMTMLHKMADEEQPDLIIGTSMGACIQRCYMVSTVYL